MACPEALVVADELDSVPAVVENDTTTPLKGLPFVSVTVAVIVDVPPAELTLFGLAVT